jgi:hypothetical protein
MELKSSGCKKDKMKSGSPTWENAKNIQTMTKCLKNPKKIMANPEIRSSFLQSCDKCVQPDWKFRNKGLWICQTYVAK